MQSVEENANPYLLLLFGFLDDSIEMRFRGKMTCSLLFLLHFLTTPLFQARLFSILYVLHLNKEGGFGRWRSLCDDAAHIAQMHKCTMA